MPIPTVGLNLFRDVISDECTDGEAGTSSTSFASSQTDLIAGVSATNIALSVTKTTAAFQTSQFLSSAVGTGNSYQEWKVENASNVMVSRALSAPINHTANDEITKITTFNIVDR